MAFRPKADMTVKLLHNSVTLVPLALLYSVMLFASWTPDHLSVLMPGSLEAALQSITSGQPKVMFVPSVAGISQIFAMPLTAVSVWAHLQFVSCFCARWIWMDGAPTHLLSSLGCSVDHTVQTVQPCRGGGALWLCCCSDMVDALGSAGFLVFFLDPGCKRDSILGWGTTLICHSVFVWSLFLSRCRPCPLC